MERKCADPAVQLEIDELILDYLVFTATKEIINYYERRGELFDELKRMSKADMLLQLVDQFLAMFQHIHPVFTKRTALKETMPSALALEMLRKKRREQANTFRSSDETLTRLHLPDMATHVAPSDSINIKQEQTFQDQTSKPPSQLPDLQDASESIPPPISLLDTLPLFMALSASQNAMQATSITKTWMQLAAGYMAQAAIEQYLVYGSQRPETLQECFAWGFDAECGAGEGSEQWQVNAMFWDEDGSVPDWDPIRDAHIHALVPPEGVDMQEHLRRLIAGDLSIINFEKHVFEFLAKVHQGQPRPLLAQVELGKVDGLSRREVLALHEAIGMA